MGALRPLGCDKSLVRRGPGGVGGLAKHHLDLAIGGLAHRGVGIVHAPAEPGVVWHGAVHAQVKADQLLCTEDAGHGTPQGAIIQGAPHHQVRTSLSSNPVSELVRLEPMPAGLS